jgi:hypothetical protein
MGAGIIFPVVAIAAVNAEAAIVSSEGGIGGSAWTPPQYAKSALTILTVPASTSNTSGQPASNAIDYVFDAVIRVSHNRKLVKTQHPVLTGANISDHAYILPTTVALEIGMSDAMASYTEGTWVGASTKSISAWQILKQLQVSKTLLTLSTRLDSYSNMLIEDMIAPDDNKTLHGLRATVILGEVIAASVSSQQPVSARPQTSQNTPNGTIQSAPINNSQLEQNVIPSSLWPDTPTYPNVPGAGNVSSNSLGQVPSE